MRLNLFDVHTLFVAGILVQATFTLTLSLLSWADRRMRGMVCLAVASAFTLAGAIMRAPRAMDTHASWDTVGGSLYLVATLCMYVGLRWFAWRIRPRTWLWPAAGVAVAAISVGLCSLSAITGLVLVRLATLVVLVLIIRVLWMPRVTELRPVLRMLAVVLSLSLALRISILLLHMAAVAVLKQAVYFRVAILCTETLLQFLYIGLYVTESKRRLHDETRTDALTGLRNRRALEETAAGEVRQSRGQGRGLALLMIDLDRFKALNDTWGHSLGDTALQLVGRALVDVVGDEELVARLGGEEFAVLLPGYGLRPAAELGERLRSRIEELRLHHEGDRIPVTASIGVSLLQPGEPSWSSMLQRADVALYRAKREGRNRVVVCEQVPESPEFQREERRAWRRFAGGGTPIL